jgi:hypothetical protein
MSKLVRAYEWAVITLAMAVFTLTCLGIWFKFIDGQIVNVPIVFNQPHPYGYPVKPHDEQIAQGITHMTTKTTYRHGEMVYAYVDLQKNRTEPGKLQWQLMDQRFYPYVSRMGVIPPGHHHMTVAIEKIPLHVPPGQYHFSGTVSYEVNFLQDIHIPIRTNCFEVVD